MHKSSLFDHLVELRRRLIWSVVIFLVLTGLSYIYVEPVLAVLVRPLANLLGADRRLIYTGLTEAFVTYLKTSCFVGLFCSLPVWSYHLFAFIRPALYQHECPQYRWFFGVAPLLFLSGAVLAYTVVCPMACKFFLSFETTDLGLPLQLEARLSEYIAFMIKLMTVFGMGFQLPLVLAIMVIFGLVRLDTLRAYRKYAFLIITVVAAVVTPPDLISPISLIIPLYGLYEGTLWVLRHFQRS